jgi:hypothetical protein
VHRGPAGRRLETKRLRRVGGQEQLDGETGQGAIGRGGAGGVAARGQRQAPRSESPRHGHRGRHAPRLARAGWIERLFLHVEPVESERPSHEFGPVKGRHPFPEADGRVGSGQHLGVPPLGSRPAAQTLRGQRAGRLVQPVSGQKHSPARIAQRARRLDPRRLPTARALEPLQRRRRAGLRLHPRPPVGPIPARRARGTGLAGGRVRWWSPSSRAR